MFSSVYLTTRVDVWMLQVTTPRRKLSTMQTRYENHISIHVKHFLPANIKMKHKFGVNQHDRTNSHLVLVHTSTAISSSSGRVKNRKYILHVNV